MERMRIAAIFADQESLGGKDVTVCGWARTIRDMKTFGFIELNDGSCFKNLQVVMSAEELANYKDIAAQNVGAALIVKGTVVLTPDAKQPLEVKAHSIEVEGKSTPDYPLQKKRHSVEFLRTIQHLRPRTNLFSATFRGNRKEEAQQRAEVLELLKVVGLEDVQNELATSLPYGKQRRLEIARALATDPTLLLLDEPAAGMNPQETLELAEFIKEIRDHFHKTILLIEHHMDLVMGIADRIYVLDFGKLIAKGTPEEIQNNERVIDAYLGVAEDAED